MEMNWRKSTRSSGNGGACVEVATWRTAARGNGNGGDRAEVACTTPPHGGDRRS
ncbi:DUF397 domain-containing protein [Actinoallomurus soli]|uniref:DUF397 domain-containing protein n=1 Tax=Actinoallomurus soli TaxID=2952535 RepID=UPI002093F8EE|nr:DUF397 domain-containing protein [Actinoallomurus soli]MCO5966853.1 DUF397 domain-containing protein [Actinoallomurus soli]